MALKPPYTSTESLEQNFIKLYGEETAYQSERYASLFEKFKKSFSTDCAYFASSSGRVEVCGNHTDHNGGRVVSCAISLDTLACFMPTESSIIHIKSEGYDDIIVDLNDVNFVKNSNSASLVKGVSVGLLDMGYKIGGFNACFTSNVLGGAGISSSASFEVLVAEIFNFLYNEGKITQEEKAKVSQFAECEYFGKPCGLLDQTAISFGGLRKLDFGDKSKIQVSSINNVLKDYTLVLVNTGGSHAELTDEYASIPKEMKMLASKLGAERLIDIPEDEFYAKLPKVINEVPHRAVSRAIHFYNENKRVDGVANSLNNNDYDTFLEMINGSGISSLCKLQNCYVVGDSEQPIVRALSICERYLVKGANRVHGGGFAGTILNVVKNDNLDNFIKNISEYFGKENIIPLKVRSEGTIVL